MRVKFAKGRFICTIFGTRGTDALKKAKAASNATCIFWINKETPMVLKSIASKIILTIPYTKTPTEHTKSKAGNAKNKQYFKRFEGLV